MSYTLHQMLLGW